MRSALTTKRKTNVDVKIYKNRRGQEETFGDDKPMTWTMVMVPQVYLYLMAENGKINVSLIL